MNNKKKKCILSNYNCNVFLDEQGDGDYFDRTEKNQLFLWGVHTEAKYKARLNNTI